METINNKIISNEASRTALWFGLISGGFVLLSLPLSATGKTAVNILVNILSLAKLVGCIWLMRYMMQKLKSSYEGVGKRELVRYGTRIALFSAIITAAVTYVSYQYLFQGAVTTIFDNMYISLQQSGLDANTAELLNILESKYATYSTLGTLLWCFVYGWILSRILAPRIAPDSIFED